jgi:hypothetical protein
MELICFFFVYNGMANLCKQVKGQYRDRNAGPLRPSAACSLSLCNLEIARLVHLKCIADKTIR